MNDFMSCQPTSEIVDALSTVCFFNQCLDSEQNSVSILLLCLPKGSITPGSTALIGLLTCKNSLQIQSKRNPCINAVGSS